MRLPRIESGIRKCNVEQSAVKGNFSHAEFPDIFGDQQLINMDVEPWIVKLNLAVESAFEGALYKVDDGIEHFSFQDGDGDLEFEDAIVKGDVFDRDGQGIHEGQGDGDLEYQCVIFGFDVFNRLGEQVISHEHVYRFTGRKCYLCHAGNILDFRAKPGDILDLQHAIYKHFLWGKAERGDGERFWDCGAWVFPGE